MKNNKETKEDILMLKLNSENGKVVLGIKIEGEDEEDYMICTELESDLAMKIHWLVKQLKQVHPSSIKDDRRNGGEQGESGRNKLNRPFQLH